MRSITICAKCGSKHIDYIGSDRCYCYDCREENTAKDVWISSPYERQRDAVYATGNRWAIENWNATH